MFRRPFRRRPRRTHPFRRHPAAHSKAIASVNQIAQDNPAEAGALLTEMVKVLQNRGQLRQAANLSARAAHTFVEAGDESAALAQARSALTLFAQYSLAQRIPVFLGNITRRMNAHGMETAADALLVEYAAYPPKTPARIQEAKSEQHGNLPTKCPDCGAPLHPAIINWLDPSTAECGYCASMVRTE